MSEFAHDSSEFDYMSRRLRAAAQIAESDRVARSERIRGEALNPSTEGLTPQQRIARIALRTAFYDLTEVADLDIDEGQTVVEWLASQTGDIPSATLGRIEMNGEWDAADRFERDLIPILSTLYDKGYRNFNVIDRTSPHAEIRVTVPAGFTKEDGYVALRRKRKFILASPSHPRNDLPPLTVHKASMFALDIEKLAAVSDVAAREVRLIVARTMFLATDWRALGMAPGGNNYEGDEDTAVELMLLQGGRMMEENMGLRAKNGAYEDSDERFLAALEDANNFQRALKRYGFNEEEMRMRFFGLENPTHLHEPQSLQFVEEALHTRNELLTPALTTFYVRT